LNVLDPRLVELIAGDLGTNPGLVEKDWHVVRALALLASLDHGDVTPVFSGGTSLSKGWKLIKRFSEDIDFKLGMVPSGVRSKDRSRRKAYRDRVIAALTAEFELVDTLKGDEDRFFRVNLAFPTSFEAGRGLRPHLRVEMTFEDTALPPTARPIQSLVGEAQRTEPEVAAFLCVDPIETAADKLSALAWRVCIRERGSQKDDPTIIRHLHDLAMLKERVAASPGFAALAHKSAESDNGRAGDKAPATGQDRLAMMFDRLRREAFWVDDYDQYVRAVSFARPGETLTFVAALDALEVLVSPLEQGQG
jgi:hypothetical protein